jgi:hypothetical protein
MARSMLCRGGRQSSACAPVQVRLLATGDLSLVEFEPYDEREDAEVRFQAAGQGIRHLAVQQKDVGILQR